MQYSKASPGDQVILIGYGGHALVAADILSLCGYVIRYYCDVNEKKSNPLLLQYLGAEDVFLASDSPIKNQASFFVCVGDNGARGRIHGKVQELNHVLANAVHPAALVAGSVKTGAGVLIAAGAVINPFVSIGEGVICNTRCSIDHECIIADFAHIGPGAVLCGNVSVGKNSFIGAGAVVREGISIGDNVMVGAGSVVVKNVENNSRVVGCPARKIKSEW